MGKLLFGIVDKYFPFEKHIQHFKECMAKSSLKHKYITQQLQQLEEQYPSLSWLDSRNVAQRGFISKVTGHDLSLISLNIEFCSWKEKERDQFLLRRIYEIDGKKHFESFERFLEHSFMKEMAQGINDARFQEYLEELLANGAKDDKPDFFALTVSDNCFTFQGKAVPFPFNCKQLGEKLTDLREEILKPDVSSFTLQSLPIDIFKDTELKYHPKEAMIVYNIIEVWVFHVQETVHHSKARLFDSFLKQCENMALEDQK